MISLIIPTKDRVFILAKTIRYAEEALASYDSEIIVVNDAEEELDLPSELSIGLAIVKNPNQGVASARNYGASLARGEWLLFLDDDMLIQQSDVQEVLLLAERQSESCYNINWEYPDSLKKQLSNTQFGRYLNHYGFTSFRGWHKSNYWNSENAFLSSAVTSQFLFIHKDVFQRIGGYNECFPHAGFEDYDLTQRLTRHQIKILIQPNTMAYHNELDRSDVEQWLARRRRGGKTRQVAVELGYSELALKYNKVKSRVYEVALSKRLLIVKALRSIPNVRAFDKLYFLLLNLLYGASVYEGYNKE